MSVTLLLALALACGAAYEPQPPTQSTGQSEPEQSQALQSPAIAEVATEPGRPMQENAGGDAVQSEQALTTDSGTQSQLSPLAAKDMVTNRPSVAHGEANEVAEPATEAIVVTAEAQSQPPAVVTEATQPPNSDQTGAPVPTQTPTEQVTQPTPTALPVQQPTNTPDAPTNTPTPVALEPLPDVGNQVGNRVPDITLELFGGATVSTSGLIEQGKPTFLFFTSTT